MDIKVREDEIFASYDQHCDLCRVGVALPDGVPEPEIYAGSDFRALFILKEAHGWELSAEESEYPRDLRHFIRDGGRYKTWGPLARWCSLIKNPRFVLADLDVKDAAARAQALRHCAFVNLKKIPGRTRSNMNEISVFAKSHAELLRAQIALYRPHVTFTCGTFGALLDVFGGLQQPKPKDCFHFFKHPELGVAIDFYHPQYLGISQQRYLDLLRSNLRHHFPARFG